MPRAVTRLPLPLRLAVLGGAVLGALGGLVGFVIGLNVYAGTAWAAAVEVGLPSGLVGLILGLAVGSTRAFLVRPRGTSHR